MDWRNNEELYPDIGDLTPQELAERNTYGYVPSRGETAPPASAPGSLPPIGGVPTPVNYTLQLNEIINALAALSRQLRTVVTALREEKRGAGRAEAFQPAPPPPAGSTQAPLISSCEAAMRIGCSVGHVRKLVGLERRIRAGRLYFTRESVEAEIARRGAGGGKTNQKKGEGNHVTRLR